MSSSTTSLVSGTPPPGVPVIPRVGWVTDRDMRRMARWVRTNRCVRAVALDWQTYSGLPVFRQQLAGLIAFDRLTGQRLHYLINGPAQESRYLALFRAVPPSRIALTNA